MGLFHKEFDEFHDLGNPDEIIIEFKSLKNNRDEYKERYEALLKRHDKKYQEMRDLNKKLNLNEELKDKLIRTEKEKKELKSKIEEYESNNNTVSISKKTMTCQMKLIYG